MTRLVTVPATHEKMMCPQYHRHFSGLVAINLLCDEVGARAMKTLSQKIYSSNLTNGPACLSVGPTLKHHKRMRAK